MVITDLCLQEAVKSLLWTLQTVGIVSSHYSWIQVFVTPESILVALSVVICGNKQKVKNVWPDAHVPCRGRQCLPSRSSSPRMTRGRGQCSVTSSGSGTTWTTLNTNSGKSHFWTFFFVKRVGFIRMNCEFVIIIYMRCVYIVLGRWLSIH